MAAEHPRGLDRIPLAELVVGVTFLIAAKQAVGSTVRVFVVVGAVALVATRFVLGSMRGALAGASASALLAAVELLVVVAPFHDDRELRVAAALVGLGVLPRVAGSVPALALPRLDDGRREDLAPALLVSAVCGGLGVLGAIAAAHAVDLGDARLGALLPYFAVAMALLAMAEVCGWHHVSVGFSGTVAAVAALAVAVQLALLLDDDVAAVDGGVTAAVVGAGIAVTGLLIATMLASPRPLVLASWKQGTARASWPGRSRGSSPSRWWVGSSPLARCGSTKPSWPASRGGSLGATLDSARSAHAHPPLLDVLVWASRQMFGSSDLALRLPSLVAGVLLVPAVYVTAEKLYDRRVALVAAAIVAVGPGFLWLSETAQPGALAALLATLCLLTFLNARQRERTTDWVLFGASGAALLWTHQLGIVHVVVLHAAVLATLVHRRRDGEPVGRLGARWALGGAITAGALLALVVYRNGFGPPDVLPPFEYATQAVPGAGRSVFGLVGTGLAGFFGFHPSDVTSRLLALWPLCIVVTFALMGRAWSERGALLLALVFAPFVALLVLQAAGVRPQPAVRVDVVGDGRPDARDRGRCRHRPLRPVAYGPPRRPGARGGTGRRRRRPVAGGSSRSLASTRGRAGRRPRVQPTRATRSCTPAEILGDLVRHEAPGAAVVPADQATPERLASAGRVVVFGAFDFTRDDSSLQRTLSLLVSELSAERSLTDERQHSEAKVWTFE